MSNDLERELAFVEEVKKTLREKGEKLDPEIMVRLATMRSGVIEDRGSRFAGFWRLIRLPAMATMTGGLVVMLALVFFQGPTTLQHSFAGLDDLEILVTEEGADFYAELDFYDWLAAHDAKDV